MAFYGHGQDVTDFDVLAGLAEGYDIDREAFASALATDEAKKRAWSDFSRARNWASADSPRSSAISATVGLPCSLEDGPVSTPSGNASPRSRSRRHSEEPSPTGTRMKPVSGTVNGECGDLLSPMCPRRRPSRSKLGPARPVGS